MRARGLRAGGVLVLVAAAWSVGGAVSTAWGQNVLSAMGNWASASAPPGVPPTIIGSGTGVMTAAVPIGGTDALILNRARVTLRQDSGNVAVGTLIQVSTEQTFTLAENAHVAVPTFLSGSFQLKPNSLGIGAVPNVNGGVGLLSVIQAVAEVELIDSVLGTVAHSASVTRTLASPGADSFLYTTHALPSGDYKLRATLTLEAYAPAAPAMPAGFTEVLMDFISGNRWGLASSLAAFPNPATLGDSRAAVKAAAARTEFGVTGQNVKVGVYELREPFNTHAFLAGRVTRLSPTVSPAAGNLDGEHALAVAGIIAADAGPGGSAGQFGIAPAAQIVGAAILRYRDAIASSSDPFLPLKDLYDNGVRIINMSASSPSLTESGLSAFINARPDLTFVKSAGNDGAPGTISPPGLSHNIITVGALNRTFTLRAEFSSYNGTALPYKPDLVAPGEYILSTVARDINGDNQVNDTLRHFLGSDYFHDFPTPFATTGAIGGTSFAAPHVSGAVALLHELSAKRGGFDKDWRVMKAVLMNSAQRQNLFRGDGATPWSQQIFGSFATNDYEVRRPLDPELGAGKLDVLGALINYFPGEVDLADNNTDPNRVHDATGAATATRYPAFWDLETVAAATMTQFGYVSYLLGDIVGVNLRAALVWGARDDGTLPNLDLHLYVDGVAPENTPGFNPLQPDFLVASSISPGDSVELFDFIVPFPSDRPMDMPRNYYLVVENVSSHATTFALAVMIPEPGSLAWLAVPLALLGRRRCRGSAARNS
ncbi:MAG: S8 family serine peptidase [Tepidisphaerales bacterium]